VEKCFDKYSASKPKAAPNKAIKEKYKEDYKVSTYFSFGSL